MLLRGCGQGLRHGWPGACCDRAMLLLHVPHAVGRPLRRAAPWLQKAHGGLAAITERQSQAIGCFLANFSALGAVETTPPTIWQLLRLQTSKSSLWQLQDVLAQEHAEKLQASMLRKLMRVGNWGLSAASLLLSSCPARDLLHMTWHCACLQAGKQCCTLVTAMHNTSADRF